MSVCNTMMCSSFALNQMVIDDVNPRMHFCLSIQIFTATSPSLLYVSSKLLFILRHYGYARSRSSTHKITVVCGRRDLCVTELSIFNTPNQFAFNIFVQPEWISIFNLSPYRFQFYFVLIWFSCCWVLGPFNIASKFSNVNFPFHARADVQNQNYRIDRHSAA